MLLRSAVVLLWMLSLGLPATPASANPISIFFVGQVTYVGAGVPAGQFTTLGNTVFGQLGYTTEHLTLPPLASSYQLDPPGGVRLAGPDYGIEYPFIYITISDVTPGGSSSPDSWSASGTPDPQYSVTVKLSDDTQTMISSPTYFTPLSLAGWSRGEVFITSTNLGPPVTLATITLSSWIALAPEPSALALLAASALLLGARRAHGR